MKNEWGTEARLFNSIQYSFIYSLRGIVWHLEASHTMDNYWQHHWEACLKVIYDTSTINYHNFLHAYNPKKISYLIFCFVCYGHFMTHYMCLAHHLLIYQYNRVVQKAWKRQHVHKEHMCHRSFLQFSNDRVRSHPTYEWTLSGSISTEILLDCQSLTQFQ